MWKRIEEQCQRRGRRAKLKKEVVKLESDPKLPLSGQGGKLPAEVFMRLHIKSTIHKLGVRWWRCTVTPLCSAVHADNNHKSWWFTQSGANQTAPHSVKEWLLSACSTAAAPPFVPLETFPPGPRQSALGEHRVPLASVVEGGLLTVISWFKGPLSDTFEIHVLNPTLLWSCLK